MQLEPLRRWSPAPRAWAAGFLILAALGLAVSLAYLHFTSTLGVEGIRARFSGPETEAIATHSFLSLLQTTHTHLFTLAFLQLALGGLFLASSAPTRLKAALAGGTFGLILLDHAAMWLTKLSSPAWAPLLWVSGCAMTLALALEIAWSLADLGRPQ